MFSKTKRLVIVSDLHSGHIAGLTHPDFNPTERDRDSHAFKLYRMREQYWKFYAKTLKDLQPVHALIVNGDCLDGKGAKSGGTELLTTDQGEQVSMAVAAIEEAKAGKIYMSYGTSYHVSSGGDDWERQVADKVGAVKIGSHDWLDVQGLVFDYRHHCGSSSVPYGRHTAVAKERVWNLLWAEHQEYPKAAVFIRSHVHYFSYCGGHGWLAMTTPALQGCHTKYGARRMSGTVDFGLIHFDIKGKDDWSWASHILKTHTSRRHTMKL